MEIYQYPSVASDTKLAQIKSRELQYSGAQMADVEAILQDVKHRGDAAILEYTQKFDAPNMHWDAMFVTEAEFAAAEKAASPEFLRALNRAATQIELFHAENLPKSWQINPRQGVTLGKLVRPVERAGLYVPGGTGGNTPLISSALMCGIPAKIAGVKDITMLTPPRGDNSINPYLLLAAKRAGVTRVIKTSSAWGIGALAFGTKSISKVDVIVGPGNLYVTLAKKIVSGTVGIDMIAGPSEILVLADDTANPAYVAADLLSQAEHATEASAVLVTPSQKLAQSVAQNIKEQLIKLPRVGIAKQSLANFGGIFVVANLDEAFDLANNLAPEHFELIINDAQNHLHKIKNAGAVFIGNYTPEAIGDYIAGTNHVLPTAGTARFAQSLGVENFIKKISLIEYSQEAFAKEADDVELLARFEGLDAHAESITIRR